MSEVISSAFLVTTMKKSLKEKVLSGQIPNHIAIIMDGNGRWAKEKSLPRIAGHREGINSVREITRICGNIGVKHLTLYTFSTENWSRPSSEVDALMILLMKTIKQEIKELHKNNVRFTTIGDLESLPSPTSKGLIEGIELTKENNGLNLCLALNYGSRQEIINAVKLILLKIQSDDFAIDDINIELINKYLYTKLMPDPDLLIRTSGENRLSNFLLWQLAYTEIHMTDTYWPDFRDEQLMNAILDFQSRERRFGKVSSQVKN